MGRLQGLFLPIAHIPPWRQKIEHIDFPFLYALTLLLYFISPIMAHYANCKTLVSIEN